jgi:hypothetical protein
MYMEGFTFNSDYPSWIAGPVVDSAKTVMIRFRNATALRVPTSKQVQLGKVGWYGAIRFFAAPLPQKIVNPLDIASVTGFDAHGNVVACSVLAKQAAGFTPLSACK